MLRAGTLWINNQADGIVQRADPTDWSVLATLEFDGAPTSNGRVLAGSGWVIEKGTGVLNRIDLDTNTVTARIPVGEDAHNMQEMGGALWLGLNTEFPAPGRVTRIDPETNTVVATIDTANEPHAVVPGFGTVRAATASPGPIIRIDPATNAIVAAIDLSKRGHWDIEVSPSQARTPSGTSSNTAK